jgi:hypothetical protein
MTIDPSSIPSFGVPQPAQPVGPPPIIKPDQALVASLLDQMQLKHAVDDEGDLWAGWEGYRVFYMFRGEQQELFAVRSFYERPYPVEKKAEMLDLIDDWNRNTLWPKVYTHTHEDGVVRLIGEAQLMLGTGINIDLFASTVVHWTQAAIGFDGWLKEQLGLQQAVDGVGSPDDAAAEDAGTAEAAEAGAGEPKDVVDLELPAEDEKSDEKSDENDQKDDKNEA